MPVEIIVLPPGTPDARPQMLLNGGGIWRDVTPSAGDAFSAKEFRKKVETVLTIAMQQVSLNQQVNAMAQGFSSSFAPLYQELMPIEVRVAIASMFANEASPLLRIHLHPSAEWIPWELLHDGQGFLGLRMQVVRMPVVTQAARIAGPTQRDVRSVYNLLGNGALDAAIIPGWENTFATFNHGGWEKRCPNGGGQFASLDEFTSAAGADIIHITCHGGLRDDENQPYYWSLDPDAPLYFNYRITSDTLAMLQFDRSLVFGNACSTAKGGKGVLHGFGALFMMKGALNFIGTLAPITQKTSVDFATAFYGNLLDPGKKFTIADALLETKKSFIANTADPSYLFYSLYGPPDILYRVP
ncbi:MAG TPA: CHAT domain-containing protein [Thermoanaerobaculia bacterium]|nr:CHAT domain-containing protein [Thermoanaerobaculia bacterium]